MKVVWTEYLEYRARLRGFDLAELEAIVRFSSERYEDRMSGRIVVVGRHAESLVALPCESTPEAMTPVTVHRTSRQQINARLRSGRYRSV